MTFDGKWTFAGDEAGDTSFRFNRGATRYFVIAIIGTQQPDALRSTLINLRRQCGLSDRYEFSFHGTTGRQLRSTLLKTVANLDFRAWGAVTDKTEIPDALKVMPTRSFYAYMVARTIETIRLDWRESSNLLLDEFDRSGKTLAELKKILKLMEIQRGFKRIHHRRSHSDELIQIAYLVAGAIFRRYARKDDSAYRWFESKIESLGHIKMWR